MRLMTPKAPLATLAGVLIAMTWTVLPGQISAAPVTFSGTVTYQGSSAGDTLFVAVIDTVGVEDVTLLGLVAISVAPPPFAQAYSIDFDNTGVGSELFVAAFLDVDGGGIGDIGGADVFGWYDGNAIPAGIPPTSSHSGLDFPLPRAEIHGTVTFAPGQVEARIEVSSDPMCMVEGFRPGHFLFASGPYAIIGVYPGTYCVSAEGSDMSGPRKVCYGDPTCANPTSITLSETEVRVGVDLDFSPLSVEKSAWGDVKFLFR